MNRVKIKCPAKINLTLEVVNKREDGYHNIKSIMQTVSLYDYLTVSAEKSAMPKIELSGTSMEIPYNEKNLVWKAADLYLKNFVKDNYNIKIHIEKNIPVSAGLAGGSTDAAGTFLALNKLFEEKADKHALEKLCAELGSDLNFCLTGGCMLAQSRGEILNPLSKLSSDVTLIKPLNLGISAKEAYQKYSDLKVKPNLDMTQKMISQIEQGGDFKKYLHNDLENAVFEDYSELKEIKAALPDSIMSGSGSAYFILRNLTEPVLDENYKIYSNLHFTDCGVEIIE